MKLKLLFIFSLLLPLTLFAQDGSVEAPLKFKFTTSPNSGIDLSTMSVNVTGVTITSDGFQWNADDNCMEATAGYSQYAYLNYSIYSADGCISISGYKIIGDDFSSTDGITFDIPLTDLYKVLFKTNNADCTLDINGITTNYTPPTYDDKWIYTSFRDDITYLYPADYSATPTIQKGSAMVYSDIINFTVEPQINTVSIDLDFDKLYLTSISLEDVDGVAITDASIEISNTSLYFTLYGADKAEFYLPNGTYSFAPSIPGGYWCDLIKSEFAVDGKGQDIKYSFKDEKWQKLTFNISGVDPGISSLMLSTIGGSEYSDFSASGMEDNMSLVNAYVPNGAYKYMMTVMDKTYKSYPQRSGIINTENTTTVNLSYSDDSFTKTTMKYTNLPSSYSLDMLAVDLFMNGNSFNSYYGGNPEFLLTPGVYSYMVIHAWSTVMKFGTFEITSEDASKEITIDLGNSTIYSMSVSMSSRPVEMENLWISFQAKTLEGINVGYYTIPSYSNTVEESIALPAGKYIIEFDDYMAWGSGASFVVAKTFEIDLNSDKQAVVLNFDDIGKAKFAYDDSYGYNLENAYLYKDGALNKEITFYGSSDLIVFGDAGNYSFFAMGSKAGHSLAKTKEKAFTLAANSNDQYIIDFSDLADGISMKFHVEDINGAALPTQTKITVNGQSYNLETGVSDLLINNMTSNEITYKVEATGYETYETTFAVTDAHRKNGFLYTVITLSAKTSGTGLAVLPSESIRIESNVVDSQIELYNDATRSWKAYIINTNGQLINSEMIGSGSSTINVSHLSKGHYILVLTDGSQKKTIRILKK